MKNLLKKTFSLLVALAILLCGISAFADEGDETGQATVANLEVGRGISGTLQPDSVTEIRVYAGRSGQVRFTLTLTDDCDPNITVNGSGIPLACRNDGLPVYTFTMPFDGGDSKTISMTANTEAGYSMISEPIPEESETKPEESAPVPEPAAEPDNKPAEESEDKLNSDEKTEPETQEPAVTEPGPSEEPVTEAAEAPESGTMKETTDSEEKTGPEPQDPAVTKEESKEETAVPADAIKPETESGEPEKPAEPESIPEAEETGNQQTEEQPEEPNPELQTETEEQVPEQPTTEEQEVEQPITENSEGAAESIEIIIAKSLTPDESWKGTVRKTKPTILKLDVADSRMIHLFVEGKDVLYSVQKSDRITEDAGQTLTDTETNRSITSWAAEPGSYLISIRAGENSMGARVAISFMNDAEFTAWEEEQATPEAEEQGEQEDEIPEETEGEPESAEENPETVEGEPRTEDGEETETMETEPETVPEDYEEEENKPESELFPERSVSMQIDWDTDDPAIGDTAHMKAILEGYDGLAYSLQWQNSFDCDTWNDIPGATAETFDIMITEENNDLYWRILVYLEAPSDEDAE